MAKIVFAMNMSLDGYVDHDHPDLLPDDILFRHFITQQRGIIGSIYGRKLYELMRYWENDDANWPPDHLTFAQAWRKQHKWVASRSLDGVGPNATLLQGDLATEVRKLKAEQHGEIAVGGPMLASQLTELRLIDEYHIYLRHVVLGKGRPFFVGVPPKLHLHSSEQIGANTMKLVYLLA